jgi:DNA-binding MarR family transcriptional regulator
MRTTTLRKLVALVPMTFFRLQAASDRVHAARDLSTGLRGLLLSLDEFGPMTASRLADIRPVSRQAVHKMAEQLIARDLAEQRDNPGDKRAPLLALTDKGHAEIARLRAAENPQLAVLFRGLPAADIDAAVRVLEALSERLAPDAWRKLKVDERARTESLRKSARKRAEA